MKSSKSRTNWRANMATFKQKVADELLKLLRESVLVQSLLTLLVVATVCGLIICQRDVPKELWMLTGTIIGYWFRSKTDHNVSQTIQSLRGN